MKNLNTGILVLCVCALLSTSLYAQTVTLCIKGNVVHLQDHSNMLNGNITLDDSLEGTVTYDLTTPEDNSHANTIPEVGDYFHNTWPNGISVEINDYQFKTDPANVDFLAEIINNNKVIEEDSTYWEDAMVFHSHENVFSHPSLPAITENHLAWQLNAANNFALSSVNLPMSINLSDFPWIADKSVGFTITGSSDNYHDEFFIRVHIKEVSTCSVSGSTGEELGTFPNPATDIFVLEAEESLIGSEYSILNNMGMKVLTGTIQGNKTIIDISSLNGGQYLITAGVLGTNHSRIIKN